MPELVLHAQPVETIFDLLGHDENDMTAALGWGLTHSSTLFRRFVERLAPGVVLTEPVIVELQEHDKADGGFTDVEIKAAELHVIVEAKRGWSVPSDRQLRRYEARFEMGAAPVQRFVVLTQNGAEQVVHHHLGSWKPASPIEMAVVGWSDLSGSRELPVAKDR